MDLPPPLPPSLSGYLSVDWDMTVFAPVQWVISVMVLCGHLGGVVRHGMSSPSQLSFPPLARSSAGPRRATMGC
jgi:hypothetical protein